MQLSIKPMKKLALVVLSSLLLLNSLLAPVVSLAAPAVNPDPNATGSTTSTTTTSTSSWYNQGFTDWYAKVYDTKNPSEIYGERYTAAQVEWIIYGLFAFILNHVSDQGTSVKCISGDAVACTDAIKETLQKIQELAPPESSVNNNDKSLASLVFAERSFSGIGYVKEKLSNFAIIPQANAQANSGFGFGALDPIKGLWAATRNFAYGISVLVIMIFAFMIMFRIKISPQVVISVQSALPKIISALVFVTFSYAIAGFMIDLMYVVIGLLSLFIGQVIGDPAKMYEFMTEGAPIVGGGFLGLMGMYCVLFFWTLLFTLFASGNVIVNLVISPILLVIFLLLIIIVAIMLIFMFFKILWLLLKTLAQTYLLVIFGPLQIMLGTLSQGMGFGMWLRSLAANLAVYPLVGTLFAMSFIFLFYSILLGLGKILDPGSFEGLIHQIMGAKGISLPVGKWNPPLTLGESYVPLIFTGISYVILTIIPKSAEVIQGFISGKPFAYGSAIGEDMSKGAGFAKGYGLYSASMLSRSAWPFPFNLFMGRRGPDGNWYPNQVPQSLERTAESIVGPAKSVTEITRGAKL